SQKCRKQFLLNRLLEWKGSAKELYGQLCISAPADRVPQRVLRSLASLPWFFPKPLLLRLLLLLSRSSMRTSFSGWTFFIKLPFAFSSLRRSRSVFFPPLCPFCGVISWVITNTSALVDVRSSE